jgi:tripartite-type tricarboxylate transporter receptor subunit TctC
MTASGLHARLRALGVCSLQRFARLPEVPTVSESGVPSFMASPFSGMVAPAGTSIEMVGKLNAALVRMLQTQQMKERSSALGIDPRTSTPVEFSAFLQEQIAKWAGVVRAAGLKPELNHPPADGARALSLACGASAIRSRQCYGGRAC